MRATVDARNARKRLASDLFARGAESGAIVFALAELKRGVDTRRAARIAREREKGSGR